MDTSLAEPRTRTGKLLWVLWPVVDELEGLRRAEEPLNDVIARLIRFHKRFRNAAEAHLQEEFLP